MLKHANGEQQTFSFKSWCLIFKIVEKLFFNQATCMEDTIMDDLNEVDVCAMSWNIGFELTNQDFRREYVFPRT